MRAGRQTSARAPKPAGPRERGDSPGRNQPCHTLISDFSLQNRETVRSCHLSHSPEVLAQVAPGNDTAAPYLTALIIPADLNTSSSRQ